MEKPELCLVTTDYDWPKGIARAFREFEYTEKDLEDDYGKVYPIHILSPECASQRRELFRDLKKARPGRGPYPHVELCRGVLTFRPRASYTKEVLFDPPDYCLFKKILFVDPKLDKAGWNTTSIRSSFPASFTHIDLVFDFYSNFGSYDALKIELFNDFSLRIVNIRR